MLFLFAGIVPLKGFSLIQYPCSDSLSTAAQLRRKKQIGIKAFIHADSSAVTLASRASFLAVSSWIALIHNPVIVKGSIVFDP